MVLKILILLSLCCFCSCQKVAKVQVAKGASAVLDSIVVMESELQLVFSGDVMQHYPQVVAARMEDGTYDYSPCFQYIKPLWESADFAIVNLETTLSERGSYSGYPRFKSPVSLATALKKAGVDVAVLANNHSCDRGARGIRTTIRTIDSLGMLRAGVFTDSTKSHKPTMLRKGDFRVALLNCTYGTNGLPIPRGMVVHLIDTVRLKGEIAQAKTDQATHIILFVHWGDEYVRTPNDFQKHLAEWSLAQGVDVIVGSHPHVVQPIDTANRVVWSLGNLVSNQRNRYRDGGICVRVRLSMSRRPTIESLPHWVWCPVEDGRRRYYIVPAYVSGEEVGMDSATNRLFRRALYDNRAAVGSGVNEVVL